MDITHKMGINSLLSHGPLFMSHGPPNSVFAAVDPWNLPWTPGGPHGPLWETLI